MSAPPPLDLRRDGAVVAVVIAASLALQLVIYDRWISLLDEGAIVQIADQINHGKLPYRDAVHVALPGVFYLTAALFRVFGPSFLVGRYLMVAVFTVFVVLVYLLARTVLGRGAALGAALIAVAYRIWAFPHWHMLSYTPLAITCLMGAVTILASDIRRPHKVKPLFAGLAVGLGITFKQDCTAVTLGALGLFVLLTPPKPVPRWRPAFRRALTFGIAGLVAPTLAVLAFVPSGLALEVLRQTIWFPLVAQPVWAPSLEGQPHPYIGFPPLWPPWGPDEAIRRFGFFSYFPSLLLDMRWRDIIQHPVFQGTALPEMYVRAVYCLPYALLAFFTAREIFAARSAATAVHARSLRLLLVFGVALMASFNRPRDWIHLMILYPPIIILLAALMDVLAGSAPGTRRRLVHGAAAAMTVLALALSFGVALAARTYYSSALATPRAGVRVNEDVAACLGPLIETLTPAVDGKPAGGNGAPAVGETGPAPLAALPYHPTLNFLTGRPLATRFFTMLPLEEFPDRQEQILADLARDPRTEMVYSLQHAASIPRPQRFAPKVFDVLVERYRLGEGPGEIFNGTRPEGLLFARLMPRPSSSETVVYDFAAHLADATVHEVGGWQDGPPTPAGTDARASLEVWPFERPVIAVTPASPPGHTLVTYTVDVPAAARLRFGAGINPDEWTHFLPIGARFIVRVDDAVVFDRAIDPRANFEDRRWVWADLPIPAGGRRVVFEVAAHTGFGAQPNLAGWARPRIAEGE
jgi:hypothetical protein